MTRCALLRCAAQGAPLVPEKLWVSAEKLDPAGAYLLENGCEAFLFLGKAAPAELCMAILGGSINRGLLGLGVGVGLRGSAGLAGVRPWARRQLRGCAAGGHPRRVAGEGGCMGTGWRWHCHWAAQTFKRLDRYSAWPFLPSL